MKNDKNEYCFNCFSASSFFSFFKLFLTLLPFDCSLVTVCMLPLTLLFASRIASDFQSSRSLRERGAAACRRCLPPLPAAAACRRCLPAACAVAAREPHQFFKKELKPHLRFSKNNRNHAFDFQKIIETVPSVLKKN
ncbi:hypothetical protein MmiEs2_00270 [Methanimicrococcus stummii]|uniref:Uncharacterized protein n=1 Tax=Methanimicrococcus stummii TaxID=3028294 RepID=A0AA96V791_9EURY|nr:hypothetical protein MmiEs2_00270 [Methanimicrococcus sp. Es2]